jgi:hypothetical protein
MAGYVDAFEEAGLLKEFIRVLDYVDSTLAAVERYGPLVIVRTLVNDGLRMLDDFAEGVSRIRWQGDGPRLRGASRPTL